MENLQKGDPISIKISDHKILQGRYISKSNSGDDFHNVIYIDSSTYSVNDAIVTGSEIEPIYDHTQITSFFIEDVITDGESKFMVLSASGLLVHLGDIDPDGQVTPHARPLFQNFVHSNYYLIIRPEMKPKPILDREPIYGPYEIDILEKNGVVRLLKPLKDVEKIDGDTTAFVAKSKKGHIEMPSVLIALGTFDIRDPFNEMHSMEQALTNIKYLSICDKIARFYIKSLNGKAKNESLPFEIIDEWKNLFNKIDKK